MESTPMKSMVERHDELEGERREVIRNIQEFNHKAKKTILDHGPIEALSINWSMIRRIARHE